MFNHKNLQLASYGHLDFYYFQSFLNHYSNASLLNLDGDLLYSKDSEICSTTTSRIVSYQIVKKYLKLNPGDVFMTNDPQNGGYCYSKIFFISCLTSNLFLIWTNDLHSIDFKIPLSPLLENGEKNLMLWQALVENHIFKKELTHFFDSNILIFLNSLRAYPYLSFLSDDGFQKIWFSTCKAEFNQQFESKPQGQSEKIIRYKNKTIKMVLTIEEKQNQKNVILDFSNSELLRGQDLTSICAASHIVESALIQEFVFFYKLHNYLSQPILNQFRLLLPPKSVVSQSHELGLYNFEIQCLVRQIFKGLFNNLNQSTQKSKTLAVRQNINTEYTLKPELMFEIKSKNEQILGIFLDHQLNLTESNVHETFNHFVIENYSAKESIHQIELLAKTEIELKLNIFLLKSDSDQSKRFFKLNGENLDTGTYKLKNNDKISVQWKIS